MRGIENKEGKPYILVDGIVDAIDSTIRNIYIARAAHDELGLNVGFLHHGDEGSQSFNLLKDQGFRPFNIYDYMSSGRIENIIKSRVYSLLKSTTNREDLEKIRIDNIKVGDLVYDSVVRKNRSNTVSSKTWTLVFGELLGVYRRLKAFKKILNQVKVRHISLSHKYYTRFGIYGRIAVNEGIDFISQTSGLLRRNKSKSDISRHDLYLTGYEIEYAADNISDKDLKEYIKDRFKGIGEGYSIKNAYKDKCRIDNEIFSTKRKNVLIAPHVFSDATHSDIGATFTDYYQWFLETTKAANNNEAVNWLVKPHPSAHLYDEKGSVKRMVKDMNNITFTGYNITTDSVLNGVDFVITVRSTIGLDALLFNCTVLTAGNSYYEDIGNVTQIKSKQEYIDTIKNFSIKRKEISKETKKKAAAFLFYKTKSITQLPECVEKIMRPGLEMKERKEINKLHEEQFNTLDSNDLLDDNYYNKLKEFFRKDKSRLDIL